MHRPPAPTAAPPRSWHRVVVYSTERSWPSRRQQPASILELIVHKPTWDSLAPHQQAAIETACSATAMWQMARGLSVQADALAYFESEGVTIHTWPPELLAALCASRSGGVRLSA